MTPERWARIKEIFAAVTDLSAEERTPALIQACQGEADLQAELEQLLAQHDEMGQFLDGSPSAPASGLLIPGFVAERYRIVTLLGSGGMGEVYEAEDTELGGRIALKVVHPQVSWDDTALDRFRREVQLARHVTHPNVCRVFDIGHHRQPGLEIIFLTMELVRGETLSARLKREGRIASGEASTIAVQLCGALGAAHQAGILHRDFKPGNVMLIGAGERVRAVVTDFGIARWLGATEDAARTLTSRGAIFGTPAYMSPEQIQGNQLSGTSDIYSLGLVLYEMVTGTRPFQDPSPWTEAMKRLTDEPLAPAEVNRAVADDWNATILRCLERDPARRMQSTQEVLAGLSGKATALALSRRQRLATVAAALVVMLTAASFVFRSRLWQPALPASKHIAVLPFRNVGNDPESQAAADELGDSLTENLAHLQSVNQDVWVAPWKSVQKRTLKDEQHAGSALGVNLLVTGDIERQGGSLRVHARVKDARTLKELRRQDIAIPSSEVTATEDTLLQRVSGMLELEIPSGLLHHLPVDETSEPGAYELYEQGRGYLAHYDNQNVDRAIVLFQKAIDKDSKFALAHASLASAYAWKFHDSNDSSWLAKSQQACNLAISLNDRLALAQVVQGRLHEYTGNLSAAIQSLERAVTLDPADDDARDELAMAYDKAGQFLQAEHLFKETLSRNRASWVNYDFIGAFYYRHLQYDQAEPLFRAAMDLAPDNPIAFYNLAGMDIRQGKCGEAGPLLTHAIAIAPSASAYSNLGTVHFCLGKYADAAAMFQKAIDARPSDHRLWRNLGDALTGAGDRTQAGSAYTKAIEMAEKGLQVDRKNSGLIGDLALYQAKLGKTKEAEQTLARAPQSASRNRDFLLLTAEIYEAMGKRERALATIHGLLQGGYPVAEIENDFEFAKLRQDQRYLAMVGANPR